MRKKVETELRDSPSRGVIEPVKFSEWATPILPVLKPDGGARICGDYKLTVNPVSKLEQYPIPSPAIFQRMMEGLLSRIPNVAVYLDDILLTGRSDHEHLETLNEVLRRLQEAGLRLKRNKCAFLEREAEFLGYKVDSAGLHPLPNKEEQERAFGESKKLLQSSKVLVHYDSQKDLLLACDASPYGVGAVLSHRMSDGQERPIGFMSRTLTPAKSNYSQLDKEGLAVTFGIQRFHKYLYGRRFVISTDHKPLLSLFNELKAVPQMASPRIQRWAVTLRAYEYEIVYKPGKYHGNADALSRVPLPQPSTEKVQED
uniref:ribonuclease H n=1 Tax=Knipowitschia caucasica TaxID=637954 RepID=A0AAV2MCZ8_KNICA